MIPEKISKYAIVKRIGRGGMGYVYRALDPVLKRDVALKTMLKDISDDPDLRSRFVREAQSAGGLRHPNIVTIYDLGEDQEGCPFIAMEFLTGTDLDSIIKDRIELQVLKKLDIIIQTCSGLGYAHHHGIIHRDIKPANIRLLDNGEIKIMDFGIAKMTASRFTRTGMIMGTPHYMAPEQIRGETVDGRADIFSVGVVLYELLTSRKPFPGDNPTTVLFKIIHSDPDPLTDPEFTPPAGLEEIIAKALAKKKEDRFQTCDELKKELQRVYARLEKQTGTTEMLEETDVVSQEMDLSEARTQLTPLPDSKPVSTPSPIPASVLPDSPPETALERLEGLPGNLTPPTAHRSPSITSSPSINPDSQKWIWVGVTGLIGILVVLAIVIGLPRIWTPKHSNQSDSSTRTTQPLPANQFETGVQKPEQEPPPVPVAPITGWLSLNIQPWARITELTGPDGKAVPTPQNLTPCRLQLTPGQYQVRLDHPNFKPLILKIEVKENITTYVSRKLEGFDYAKALESLDL